MLRHEVRAPDSFKNSVDVLQALVHRILRFRVQTLLLQHVLLDFSDDYDWRLQPLILVQHKSRPFNIYFILGIDWGKENPIGQAKRVYR